MAGGIATAYGLQGRMDPDFERYKYYDQGQKAKAAKADKARADKQKGLSDAIGNLVNTNKFAPWWNDQAEQLTADSITQIEQAYQDDGVNEAVVANKVMIGWQEGINRLAQENDSYAAMKAAYAKNPDAHYINTDAIDFFDNPENVGQTAAAWDVVDPLFGVRGGWDDRNNRLSLNFEAVPRYDIDKWDKDNIKPADYTQRYTDSQYLSEFDKTRYRTSRGVPEEQLSLRMEPLKSDQFFVESAMRNYTLHKRKTDPTYKPGAETGSIEEDSKKALEWDFNRSKKALSERRQGFSETIQAKRQPKTQYRPGVGRSITNAGEFNIFSKDYGTNIPEKAIGNIEGIDLSRKFGVDYSTQVDVINGYYDLDKKSMIDTEGKGKKIDMVMDAIEYGLFDPSKKEPEWYATGTSRDEYYDSSKKLTFRGDKNTGSGWRKHPTKNIQVKVPLTDRNIKAIMADFQDEASTLPEMMNSQQDKWNEKQKNIDSKKGAQPTERKIRKSVIETKVKNLQSKGDKRDYAAYLKDLQKNFEEQGVTLIVIE